MPITRAHADLARLDWHRHGQAAAVWAQRRAELERLRPEQAERDAAFVALRAAYRGHGGIAQGDSLAASMGRAGHGGYVGLTRRIVAGELFSFRWNETFWVPLFQFEPVHLTLRAAPRRVLNELHGVLDGWAIASWFVRAHEGLRQQRPLDLLDSDIDAVLAAARAERGTAAA